MSCEKDTSSNNHPPPSIIILPTQGFCNRLRALASAYTLAKYFNTSFYLNWEPEECCNCDFEDIFTNKSFRTIDMNTVVRSNNYLFSPNTHTNNLIPHMLKNGYDYVIIKGGHEFKHPDMPVLEFLQHKHQFYKSLCFTAQINNIVNLVNCIDCVGVHYRDFVPKYDSLDGRDFSARSPIESFMEVIMRLYHRNNSTRFYLSSNTNVAFEHISKRIPTENIVCLKDIETERNSSLGVIHAVSSLLLLSRCRFVVGTVMSSFSDEACFFHNISKLCIGDEKISAYHCYGYNEILDHKMLLPNCNILYHIYKEEDGEKEMLHQSESGPR